MPSESKQSAAQLAFSGAFWLLLFTIVQRLLTFSLNQALIQWTSPEVFGYAAIKLELVLSTLLFVSREGIRLVSLRCPINNPSQLQRVVNLSWLPPVMILLIVALSCGVNYALCHINVHCWSLDADAISIFLYCLGAFLEALGEPWRNVSQNVLELKPRLRADMIAIVFRSIVTFVAVAMFDLGAVGFGLAQIAFGLVHFLTLVCHTNSITVAGTACAIKDFLPHSAQISVDISDTSRLLKWWASFVEPTMFMEACTTTSSSVLKHALTESDKIVLSLCSSTYDQGIFAVANNYGSLVARMIYLPIEESSRLAFAKMSSELNERKARPVRTPSNSLPENDKSDGGTNSHVAYNNDESSKSSSNNDITTSCDDIELRAHRLEAMSSLLCRLLAVVGLIGVIFPAFGVSYVRLAVRYALGAKWRGEETVKTLQAFCWYIFVMGINGVSESFVYAVATERDYRMVNASMVCSTAAYVAFSVPLVTRLGTCGVVIGGALSMVVRISFNFYFIQSYFVRAVIVDFGSTSNAEAKKEAKEKDGVSVVGGSSFAGAGPGAGAAKKPITALVPPPALAVVLALCAAAAVLSAQRYRESDQGLRAALLHLAVGIAAFIAFAVALLCIGGGGHGGGYRERIRNLFNLIRGRGHLEHGDVGDAGSTKLKDE